MNPYSITAPEEIAKKYGGNKKKIQQAAAQGLINPTEAVMAGMFIDRVRNAAQAEQAQQPTVAEQVMNPQPQMPPQGGMPPQMPPQGMAAMPQAQQMPQQAQMGRPQMPPQGMAMGGGLDAIPYNEGDYAEGGIVSFNQGGGYGEAMSQLRRQLGAARTQAQRDQITAAMDQLRAKYEQSTFEANSQNIDDFVRENMGQPIRQGLGKVGDSLQAGFNALTSAFDSGDTDEFARVKNAQPSEVPGEQARRDRVALAMQTRGEGQNVFPVDNSDPFDVGMETFADSQQIPTSLGPQVGRGQDPRLFGEGDERRAALAALAARNPDLIDPADGMKPEIRRMTPDEIKAAGLPAVSGVRTDEVARSDFDRFLSNEGFAIKDPNAPKTEKAPTVQEQVQKTQEEADVLGGKTDTTIGGVPVNMEKPAEESAATTDMSITEQFNAFQDEMKGLMGAPEHGKYRKEFENLLNNREQRLKDAKKEGFNMALLQAGLGMLAQGGGQTALQALGKAALPATKQYAETMKDMKKEDRDLLKLGLSLENMDRQERTAARNTMVNLFGKKMSVDAQLKAARIAADKKGEGAEVLDMLVKRYGPERGLDMYFQQKKEIAAAGANVTSAASLAGKEATVQEAWGKRRDTYEQKLSPFDYNITDRKEWETKKAELMRKWESQNPKPSVGGGATQQEVQEATDKNGRAIYSNDGGNTWYYR